MSYALLGNIAFDLLNAPTGLDERRSAAFAEHQVLSGKPKLQAMGLELTEITLQLSLHHQLGAVEARYQALINAKESQQALALVFGFSKFVGHFVITDVSSQTLLTDERGNALAREVSVSLREFAGNVGQGVLGAALSIGGNSPLASILPKGLTQFVSRAKQLITQGIQVYRQTRQVISEVKQTVAVMKSLARNPREALLQLPFIVNSLGTSLAGLGEMVGLKESVAWLTNGIKEATPFMQGLADLSVEVDTAYHLFKQGLNGNEMGEWFDLGVRAIDSAEAVGESLAKNSAELTAWIAIRADTGGEQ